MENAQKSWMPPKEISAKDVPSPVVLAGWLEKKSPTSDVWQQRHCELSRKKFEYFKGSNVKPQNTILISDVKDAKLRELVAGKEKLSNGFVISVEGRDYVWRGKDLAEAETWVKAICEAIGKSFTPLTPMVIDSSLAPKNAGLDAPGQWRFEAIQPLMTGKLDKKCPSTLKTAWQTRECLLTATELQYFTPAKFSSSEGLPQGMIALSDIQDVKQQDLWLGKTLDPRGLYITTAGREYVWRAQSKEDADQWVLTIKQALASHYAVKENADAGAGAGRRGTTWDEDHDEDAIEQE